MTNGLIQHIKVEKSTSMQWIMVYFADLNPTLASTDTDAHPEYHIPKTDSIETDDELSVKVKVSELSV